MGSVVQRKSVWYAVLWNKPTKSQRWTKLPSTITLKRDATAAMRKMQDDLDRQNLGLTKSTGKSQETWANVAAKVIAAKEGTVSNQWCRELVIFTQRFLEHIGDIPATLVTQEDCEDFLILRRGQGASESYLRKEMCFLQHVFRRTGSNPWANVTKPKEPKHPPRFISQFEFRQLIQSSPPERAFRYKFLTLTGCRRAEAWAVQWKDIDLKNKILLIKNSKKGKGTRYPYRRVPICDELIRELKKRKGNQDPYLFSTQNNWQRDLTLDRRHAEIKRHIRVHDLRHTYCSWLVQAGISLHQVRDLAGHMSIKTTENYAHLLPIADEAVLDALNKKYCYSVDEFNRTDQNLDMNKAVS